MSTLAQISRFSQLWQSLVDSTNVDLQSRFFDMKIKGANSPYKSHVSIEITEPKTNISGILLNDKLFITERPYQLSETKELIIIDVPVILIGNMINIRFPHPYNTIIRQHLRIDKASMLKVAFANNFNGYNEEGEPIFSSSILTIEDNKLNVRYEACDTEVLNA